MMYCRRLWLWWLYRNQATGSLAESHLILLKSARRCAYDLRHAQDNIQDKWCREKFDRRATFWLEIFSPTGVKDYRLEMITQIEKLEYEVFCLRRELAEHGIESKVSVNDPF
jgi:hypothetical protein